MLIDYPDVTSRITEPPAWYTSQGYPRYCRFIPQETGVYVKYALLADTACQSCEKKFFIGEGFNRENMDAIMRGDKEHWLTDFEKICQNYHFGDPPNHGCIGDTMNCIDLRILEAWEYIYETEERDFNGKVGTVITKTIGWVRVPHLEIIDLRQEWAK